MNQQEHQQLVTSGVLVAPSGAMVTGHSLGNSVIVQATSLAALNSLVGGGGEIFHLFLNQESVKLESGCRT
ncbi:hypothetical protein TNCV_1589041 [Trichonephila clavipes]|uniref:Uncharacterized protein n=1 Tax=Trichonephila clavipes TaxID=2585209 RepID=A0A8X6RJH0_TRICX|nr:hypothetical protein TNCV_1589041 [Trichonephila clavipes]